MKITIAISGRFHLTFPSILNGLTPSEAALMADTRARLVHAISSPDISIDQPTRQAIADALRAASTRRAMAPFIPLSPLQRLAFLDEIRRISCAKPFPQASPTFFPGFSYPARTHTYTVRTIESRPNANMPGNRELVRVEYRELATILRSTNRKSHAFLIDPSTANQLKTPVDHVHPLTDLLTHFLIPDVPDIASLFPSRFRKLKEKLAAL